jgi:hypothetical protein
MASVSRSSILYSILIVILLAALPHAIRNLVERGDLYLFTHQFFADMMARLSGPGRFRFILQPTVAILLGTRDGVRDAHADFPPFLWSLLFRSGRRPDLLRSAFVSVRDLVAIAILLDLISQYLIFRDIHPGAALLLGPVLIGTPYTVARALMNRFTRRRTGRATSTPAR